MRLFRWQLNFQKAPKRVSDEYVTLAAQVTELAGQLDQLVALHKETRTRLESVYRAFYREKEKGNGSGEMEAMPAAATPKVVRPGDTL